MRSESQKTTPRLSGQARNEVYHCLDMLQIWQHFLKEKFGELPDSDVRQLVRQLEKLVRESEKIVVKINAALAREGSSLAHVYSSASGAAGVATSLTSYLRTPTGGCFTARDVRALNPQMSLASVRTQLNQMVVSGELEVVDVKSGRVGRPVKLYAWALAEAA